MRLDDLYLVDIIEAAERIARMIAPVEFSGFKDDEMLTSAIQYRLIVMGEACTKLQRPTRAQMPDVPIAQVSGFRNRLVHGYFSVDLEIVNKRCRVVSTQLAFPTLPTSHKPEEPKG